MWDAHACFSFSPKFDMAALERYRKAGVCFVSVNIGMDMNPPNEVVKIVSRYSSYIEGQAEKYLLAGSANVLTTASKEGKLVVGFDLEGSNPLGGQWSRVSFFYDLGVRQMLLAYNLDNQASGGCLGLGTGLTRYGRDLIREMNRVGMVVDLSHMSRKASLEAIDCSSSPAVFSHSNPSGVWKHARNIDDEQIIACAKRGGVMGINGIGLFLGDRDVGPKRFVEHIDYVV